MYQILCDGFVLYDPRDEALILKNKKCKIGSNICGEASFSIYANHPHYSKLRKLRSVFEIKQDNETIFRGRMTDDTRDFDNMKAVDLEGVMTYLNDSTIRPFAFPDDFSDATSSNNVVEYFFRWLIEQHNSQVQPFQQFKVGKVTVTDKNNYISRSSADYSKTWTIIKDKLFGSALGGYLCIRYEADGNYLDYLADYVDDNGNKLVNDQVIAYGENLLDFKCESDGAETYSAVIPLGSKGDGDTPLTIKSLADGNVTDDIVKKGDTLYSKSAVDAYGWICAPTDETTFEDITIAKNLQDRGVSFLKSKSAGFNETTTLTAIDLHMSDAEIEAFRVYRYVKASSSPHDASGVYPLSVLDMDIDDPQNTKITVGETKRTLTDKTSETANKVTVVQQTAAASNTVNQQKIAEVEKTANTANQTATTANKTAGDAKNTANAAKQTADSIKENIYLNGTTFIDGGKVATNSIDADAIKVDELFAKDINLTGSFTTTTTAILNISYKEIEVMQNHVMRHDPMPETDIPLYDFDEDGEITIADIAQAMRYYTGIDDITTWGKIQASTVTLTIDLTNPNKAIRCYGVNTWGHTVETFFGINSNCLNKNDITSFNKMLENSDYSPTCSGEITIKNFSYDTTYGNSGICSADIDVSVTFLYDFGAYPRLLLNAKNSTSGIINVIPLEWSGSGITKIRVYRVSSDLVASDTIQYIANR